MMSNVKHGSCELRIKLTFSILAIVFSVSACAQSPDCFREDVFCAALVTDTRGLNDFGLNQNTWAGLEQSKADGVVDQIAYIESVDARDYEKNIAFFIKSGYDVIITSGIGLRSATLRYADLEPASVFIGINQTDEESRANFISVTFPEDQMGFFAGALAAHLTRTNIIGAVCETSGIDAMWRYCEGFRAGAKYADDSVKAEANVKSIGAERDQGAALAEKGSSVVTSVLGRSSFMVQELMRRVKGGDFTDAEMSPIGYVALDSIIQKSLIAELDEILAGLAVGEIRTNVPVEKP
jgi:basic membrane lipoprotein Med (substrate-binding protein (PBP1-ABC) superfamily)